MSLILFYAIKAMDKLYTMNHLACTPLIIIQFERLCNIHSIIDGRLLSYGFDRPSILSISRYVVHNMCYIYTMLHTLCITRIR